jgi:disulfide bond formation protein DsbB
VRADGNDTGWRGLFVLWLVALVATLGSLFFSEIMRLPPCTLCWYQRILMYPLVVVATVGLVWRDRGVVRYAWPLVLGGLAVAVYHNLLYYRLIPDSITPCTTQVSCTSRQVEWFGFVTIPLLSLAAFVLGAASLAVFHRSSRRTPHADGHQ